MKIRKLLSLGRVLLMSFLLSVSCSTGVKRFNQILTRNRSKKGFLQEIIRPTVVLGTVAILTFCGICISSIWVASTLQKGKFTTHIRITNGDQSVEIEMDMDKTGDRNAE